MDRIPEGVKTKEVSTEPPQVAAQGTARTHRTQTGQLELQGQRQDTREPGASSAQRSRACEGNKAQSRDQQNRERKNQTERSMHPKAGFLQRSIQRKNV